VYRVGKSVKGIDAREVVEALKKETKVVPECIQVDNGSEFISKDFDKWPYENKVTLDYSRPGKPTDNPFIESFNGSFRDQCLNTHWFLSLDDTYEKINQWVEEYNCFRPHSSLNEMTPQEFIEHYEKEKQQRIFLSGASFPEAMYFATAEFPSAASENHTFRKRF
jgi:putative transposase